jgi:hypothetical protein
LFSVAAQSSGTRFRILSLRPRPSDDQPAWFEDKSGVMSCRELGNPAIKPTRPKQERSPQQNCDQQRDLKDHSKDKQSSAAKVTFMMNVRPLFKRDASRTLEGYNLSQMFST